MYKRQLYDLFRDSTFYFCNEKGTYTRCSIPYSDFFGLFSIRISIRDGSYIVDWLYRRGIKQSLKDLDGSYNEWDAN